MGTKLKTRIKKMKPSIDNKLDMRSLRYMHLRNQIRVQMFGKQKVKKKQPQNKRKQLISEIMREYKDKIDKLTVKGGEQLIELELTRRMATEETLRKRTKLSTSII